MGIAFFGFPDISPEERARRNREVDKRLHEDKMKLLGGIEKHVNELRTGYLPEKDIRYQAVKNMTPNQKVRVLAKLEEKMQYWGQYPAPIEQSLIEQAVNEFKRHNYRHKIIYNYISAKDIDEIVSGKEC